MGEVYIEHTKCNIFANKLMAQSLIFVSFIILISQYHKWGEYIMHYYVCAFLRTFDPTKILSVYQRTINTLREEEIVWSKYSKGESL